MNIEVADYCARISAANHSQLTWQRFGEPFRLLDMARFEGLKFYRLARTLAQMEAVLGEDEAANKPIDASARIVQRTRFGRYKRLLKSCGLEFSLQSADRMLQLLENNPDFTYRMFHRNLRDLYERIHDELKQVQLWRIEHPEFFQRDGLELGTKFRDAHKDVEEAGKCLAFDRNTGAVFHLMRVMEVGLRALGQSLNDSDLDPKRNPSWETILRKCDLELGKPYDKRSQEWRADNLFFSTATANLRAVKDAWRNPALHIDRYYDGEESREIWNAVKGFMRHLAQRLG